MASSGGQGTALGLVDDADAPAGRPIPEALIELGIIEAGEGARAA
jgi:hypothetical protein